VGCPGRLRALRRAGESYSDVILRLGSPKMPSPGPLHATPENHRASTLCRGVGGSLSA
jgi:hypothetical protein